MLEIGRTIVSRDIYEEYFVCDLLKCKGACCVEGDSGAPLTDQEAAYIARDFPLFRSYIPENQINEIEKQGFSVVDSDGDLVTPLVGRRQCAYSFENGKGILNCAIEKAFLNGMTTFRKPVSCHLFPIRITEYKRFDAINYQKLDICKPGSECGKSSKVHLYRFLKEPLIRKYGEEWYKDLEATIEYVSGSER